MANKYFGRGTVTEIERGRKYRLQLPTGKDPLTGKYTRVRETFLGTRRQAELRIEELRREAEQGKAPNADKILFAEWCEKYLATREAMGKHRPKTLKQDRTNSKHLLRGLGDVRLSDISPAVVSDLYVSMKKKGVGDTTLLQCHRLLGRIMKGALMSDLILKNPVERVEAPRKPRPKRNALSPSEAKRFTSLLTDGEATACKTAAFLGIATGARLSEVLGLTWEHVHLEGERPYVYILYQHTEEAHAGGDQLTPLKTDADDNPIGRVYPLDASSVSMLKRWKAAQRADLNALGVEQGSKTPIVTSSTGTFLNHSNFRKWWRGFCTDNGFGKWVGEDGRRVVELRIGDDPSLYKGCTILWRDADGWPCDEAGKRYSKSYKRPEVKKSYVGLQFHLLRHTHYTLQLASGMDIPTAQALGGWSTPQILMTTYAHPVSENVWAAAGFVDNLTAQ